MEVGGWKLEVGKLPGFKPPISNLQSPTKNTSSSKDEVFMPRGTTLVGWLQPTPSVQSQSTRYRSLR